MDPTGLIPTPESIPAPYWLFLTLDILLFILHLLVINVVLGGSLIIAYKRWFGKSEPLADSVHGIMASKLPTGFAIGINLGVAPLLFMQVIYGHFFYTSSVLMAVYWILVIPLLILAYYGAYIHIKKYDISEWLSKSAILVVSLILLYISFIQVNNNTLMMQPAKWIAYFDNRNGTILNLADPSLIPRYLHFLLASIAIAGLFMAMLWSRRQNKGVEGSELKVRSGLRLFAWFTLIQILVGFWFLMAIPREFIGAYMGKNLYFTTILLFGSLCGIGAMVTAFRGKLRPTLMMLLITVAAMIITRQNLRSQYLESFFKPDSLVINSQYDVLVLFLVILILGLISVWYMLKQAYLANERRAG